MSVGGAWGVSLFSGRAWNLFGDGLSYVSVNYEQLLLKVFLGEKNFEALLKER